MLTLEEEGAYIRLLSFCWRHGSIPADPNQAARLVGKGASTTLITVVLGMFIPSSKSGRLIHDRLEEERQKQAVWKLKSSIGGKKSALARKKMVQPPLPNGVHQNSTLQSPSPSPSPSPSSLSDLQSPPESGPEWESVKKWLADWTKNGATYTEFETRGAFLALQANGWRWGKNPVINHRSALERQIQTDRQKNEKHERNGKPGNAGSPVTPVRGSTAVKGF